MKFILGKKLGMTQVFLESGEVVPVTKIQAGPCVVVQVRAPQVQIGFGVKPQYLLNKAQAGHLRDLPAVRYLKELTTDEAKNMQRGDIITTDTFAVKDRVDVIGESKGKGFAGVVKRHHFKGGPASHGHKDNLRAPGSIGAGGVQRVFKGMRMAGHMGSEQVTIKNLEIVEIHPETNELYIKGAVPGGRNGLVVISGEGKLQVKKVETPMTTTDELSTKAEPAVVVAAS